MIAVGRSPYVPGRRSRPMLLAGIVLPLVAGGLGWWATRPEPATDLAGCTGPEAIIVGLDDSRSVLDVDPDDDRGRALRGALRLVAARPCSGHDVAAVVSFTDRRVVTGPAPIGQLGPVARAPGEQTDIAGAVAEMLRVAREHPGHRVVLVLVTDLEEGGPIPVDQTLATMDEYEVVVVSIGDADGATFRLDDPGEVANRVLRAVDDSRRSVP